jgi:hypothetical protein
MTFVFLLCHPFGVYACSGVFCMSRCSPDLTYFTPSGLFAMYANDIIPGYTIFDRIEINDIPRRGNHIRQPGVTPSGKNGKPKIHVTLKG